MKLDCHLYSCTSGFVPCHFLTAFAVAFSALLRVLDGLEDLQMRSVGMLDLGGESTQTEIIKCTLSETADDTKLSGAVDAL